MSEHDDFSGSVATAGTDTSDGSVLIAADTAEPWTYDVDGDGRDDMIQWSYADGTWEQLIDLDADGNADLLLIDVNGDENPDIQIWDNGDGTYTAAQDADGDGEFETEQTFSRADLDAALPGIAELLDTTFGGGSTPPADPTTPTDPTEPAPPAGDDLVTEHDVDGDGVVDAVEWQFGDGTWQTVVDIDGDAQADVLLIDTNADGSADFQILENGDGTYTVLQDADGDSVFEAEETFSRADLDAALPGITDLLDLTFDGGTPTQPTDPTQPSDPTQPAEPVSDDTSVPLDTDGDGVVDTIAWDFGDGTWQELRDLDGDGNADVLIIDTDFDEYGNYGIVDNGDGTYTVFTDDDNDGTWDGESTTLTRAELDSALPGITDLLDTRVDGTAGAPAAPDQPTVPDQPTGEPVDHPVDNGSDAVAYDADNDGDVDILQWSYPDGTWQQLVDLDGDANPDVLLIDTNGDANPDIQIWDNGDGTYTAAQDKDGDGEFETERTLTRDELDEAIPGITDLLDTPLTGDPVGDDNATDVTSDGPEDLPVGTPDEPADSVAGDPVGDSQYWFNQAENGFCVPASVAMIVSAYTGDALLTEEQFVEMASELGLFGVEYADASVGMTVDNALVLLEAAGVPADLVVGDMGSLTEALEEGRGVMLFVDSGEIWHGEEGSANGTDHALVVTGIDTENGVAYLSDPGHPDGNMMQVPLSVLEDAWEDGGFTMIVCDEPAPGHSDEDEAPKPAASLTDGPWALLPVVLPADSVTAA